MSAEEKPSEEAMGRPKSAKTRSIKITEEAFKSAQIASGYTGDSIVDYISNLISKHSREDIEAQHQAWAASIKDEAAGMEMTTEHATISKKKR